MTASVIGRSILGDTPFLQLPTFTVEHPTEYLLFALLGLIAGAVGVGFTKVLYAIEDLCDAVWRGPEWLRPAVGGLLLGLLLLVLPQMYGVGYPVLGNAIDGKYAIGFLIVLLVGKTLATSLTIGIGGSGGVFAPSLFIGAMLGATFGLVAQSVVPGITGPIGAYGLIGMGAVFGGAARAPITGVIIMFELTGEYSIILPIMIAVVLATLLSHRLTPDSIYTLKLSRRGIDLSEPATSAAAVLIAVQQVMRPMPAVISADTSLRETANLLGRARYGVLPLANAQGRYVGVVTARAVAEALADGQHDIDPAELLVELPITLREDDQLDQAIEALDGSGISAIPVLAAQGDQPVGWIDIRDTLRAMNPAG